jgi:sortase A
MNAKPEDLWITYPVDGKTTISLQTFTPIPTFENRLVVRGELVS